MAVVLILFYFLCRFVWPLLLVLFMFIPSNLVIVWHISSFVICRRFLIFITSANIIFLRYCKFILLFLFIFFLINLSSIHFNKGHFIPYICGISYCEKFDNYRDLSIAENTFYICYR